MPVVSAAPVPDIRPYLLPGRRVHLVGVGGVSMCPLAEVLCGMGLSVSGSDLRGGAALDRLRALGVKIELGHRADNLRDAELVVRTAAAHDDNPEIAAARAAGIPVFERAQAWGAIMRAYRNAVCIAGTHGKTTTTSMVTHVAMAAGLDPTVMIGGTLPLLGAGHRVGAGGTIVLEACEYCNSFLSFFPTVAVILNIEADHLDFFRDLEEVEASFRAFAALVPPGGAIVASADDPAVSRALAPLGRELFSFAFDGEAVVRGESLRFDRGLPSFDVTVRGAPYTHISLAVPGLHNARNALAAAAAAAALSLPGEAVSRGLAAFAGAARRFERKGVCNGAEVYDDYAHHPGELRALLTMAESLGFRRVICAFQPHTYTRTHALLDDFARELSRPDLTLLAEIYAAREENDVHVHSSDLAAKIPGARCYPTLSELTDALRAHARPGDLILTVGAGDICTVGDALVKEE